MFQLIYIVVMAIANRARGSKLFGHTTSTVVARLVATFAMGAATGLILLNGRGTAFFIEVLLWSWVSLMIWCTPAWDRYWGACLGNPGTAHGWPPVEWVMAKFFPPLPAADCPYMRFWGVVAMGLRQSLMSLWLVGLMFIAGNFSDFFVIAFTLLMGIWYFLGSFILPANAVMFGELTIGASMGILALAV